ncbi:hypothetical protein HK098_007415 [Nowakowskiella sp. JEL0407]|nr:hypothetical protein HK098_007415 [Nowakowskiella sp. JEL0407]
MTKEQQTSPPLRFQRIYDVVENVELYRHGGYHPVHFGDTFNNGRYTVVRKLGYGSFSTVWLAKTVGFQFPFVALKICKAGASSKEADILDHLTVANPNHPGYKHILGFLDQFEHQGPNGTHLCLVFEVMGVSVVSGTDYLPNQRYPVSVAKEIARQVLLGLSYVHECRIVHCDVQPGNFLFAHPNLAMLACEDFSNEPRVEVLRTDNKPLEDGDPKYLAISQYVLIPDDYFSKSFVIKVSDFGGARRFLDCGEIPVTPTRLRAPELVLNLSWDNKIDIWSMGCVIFELVTRYSLINIFSMRMTQEEIDDEQLQQLVEVIGSMPIELQSEWSRAHHYYDKNGKQLSKSRYIEMPLLQYLERVKPEDLTKEVQETFGELLLSMLQYRAEDRKSANELLENVLFKQNSVAANE